MLLDVNKSENGNVWMQKMERNVGDKDPLRLRKKMLLPTSVTFN
jgi:hypothetical protein